MANIIQIIRTPPTTRSSLSRDTHAHSEGFQQHPRSFIQFGDFTQNCNANWSFLTMFHPHLDTYRTYLSNAFNIGSSSLIPSTLSLYNPFFFSY